MIDFYQSKHINRIAAKGFRAFCGMITVLVRSVPPECVQQIALFGFALSHLRQTFKKLIVRETTDSTAKSERC
jgi:hypothetical protein